jgi:hypothetical protein
MIRIALVGCGKTKLATAARPRDLYTGPLFSAALEYAEQHFDTVRILSAKHGVVHPDGAELEPYDLTLPEFAPWELADWGHVVCAQLAGEFDLTEGLELVVLAGSPYATPISWQLPEFPTWTLDEPMRGLGIGQRLAWLKQRRAA